MLRIMSLMDDMLTGRKDLFCEHGLSMQITYGGKNILFDCGSSEKTLYNAQKLGADLSKLDAVVLSHSHYDHAGGFRYLAERYPVRRVYTGPGFFAPKYSEGEGCCRNLSAGFDRAFLEEKGIEYCPVAGVEMLCPGASVISGFPRMECMETIPKRYVHLTDGGLVPDDFRDEICLTLETQEGLVLLVGCAHPGIVNMAKQVRALLGKPIHAVIGGIHLAKAEPCRVEWTVDELEKLGVKLLGFGHCSGDCAEAAVRAREGVSGCHLGPGDCVLFG